MATQILNVKSSSSLNVRNTCTKRGQTYSFYKHDGKFCVYENDGYMSKDGYEQFIVWTDSLISFKPRQSNDIYNGSQSVMTVEQMQSICDILNSSNLDADIKISVGDNGHISSVDQQDEITLVDEKKPRSRSKKLVKTNDVRYDLARYEFVKDLYESANLCLSFLTENEWVVYKAIVRYMEREMRDVIRASDIVNGDHAIAGTISTLNMKGFVRCRVGGKHGCISAVTTKNYNDFDQ